MNWPKSQYDYLPTVWFNLPDSAGERLLDYRMTKNESDKLSFYLLTWQMASKIFDRSDKKLTNRFYSFLLARWYLVVCAGEVSGRADSESYG